MFLIFHIPYTFRFHKSPKPRIQFKDATKLRHAYSKAVLCFFSIFVAILWNSIKVLLYIKRKACLRCYVNLLHLFHTWIILRGRNLALELVRFAVSVETSSELEVFHSKHSALVIFQQSELNPSSSKWGTAPARSLVSDPLANGLWRLSIRVTRVDTG